MSEEPLPYQQRQHQQTTEPGPCEQPPVPGSCTTPCPHHMRFAGGDFFLWQGSRRGSQPWHTAASLPTQSGLAGLWFGNFAPGTSFLKHVHFHSCVCGQAEWAQRPFQRGVLPHTPGLWSVLFLCGRFLLCQPAASSAYPAF